MRKTTGGGGTLAGESEAASQPTCVLLEVSVCFIEHGVSGDDVAAQSIRPDDEAGGAGRVPALAIHVSLGPSDRPTADRSSALKQRSRDVGQFSQFSFGQPVGRDLHRDALHVYPLFVSE